MFSGPDSLYQSVLQTELLGSATQLPAPGGSSANLPISLSLSVHPKHPPAPTILRFEPSRIYHRTSPQDRSRQAAAQLAPGLALAGFLTIESQVLLRSRAGFNWSMPVTPIKVLDAPGLTRQVVRSVLDWSSIGTLAVGLPDDVYTLPNAAAQSPGTVAKLPDPHGVQDPVAVRWCPNGTLLACANHAGIQIFDGPTLSHMRTLHFHSGPANSLAFVNNTVLCSGMSQPPGAIHQTDLRAPLASVRTLTGHRAAVASLSCAPLGGPRAGATDAGQLLASGGYDCTLLVWDSRGGSGDRGRRPLMKRDRQGGPVLATAWSGQQRGVLASCGGEDSTELRIWDTKLAPRGREPVAKAKADTMICNVGWSETSDELATTHALPKAVVQLWRCPALVPAATLSGHTDSVTQMAGPVNSIIVTGSGDETVRFWECFPPSGRAASRSFDAQARGTKVRAAVGKPAGMLDVVTVR